MHQATDNGTITVGALGVRFLVEASDSNGSASVFECYVPAHARMPAPHSHDGFEETIYGLEGALVWTVEGQEHEVGSGEVLCIPRGAVHQFANVGEVGARALAIVTPGVLGPEYFRGIAAVLQAAVDGPPDLAAIAAVMRRHGLTPA